MRIPAECQNGETDQSDHPETRRSVGASGRFSNFSRFYLLNLNESYITLTDNNLNATGAIPADFGLDRPASRQ